MGGDYPDLLNMPGQMRVISVIEDPVGIKTILKHLGL